MTWNFSGLQPITHDVAQSSSYHQRYTTDSFPEFYLIHQTFLLPKERLFKEREIEKNDLFFPTIIVIKLVIVV